MNFKTILSILFVVVSIGMFSCGDNDDDQGCSTNYGTELQAELNAVSTAATNYGQNPTTANCNAYKVAFQAYINALEPYGNCSALTGQQKEQWQISLDTARANLNALVC